MATGLSCKPSHARRRKTRFGNLRDLPRLWKRFIEDTFVIMKKSNLSEFLTHLNTIENSIQFMMEQEKECLRFLDLLIKRSPNGH